MVEMGQLPNSPPQQRPRFLWLWALALFLIVCLFAGFAHSTGSSTTGGGSGNKADPGIYYDHDAPGDNNFLPPPKSQAEIQQEREELAKKRTGG